MRRGPPALNPATQCRCGPPPLQHPHEPEDGFAQAEDSLALSPPLAEANTESFLTSFDEPQWGHLLPTQSLERTRISLSLSHLEQ